MARRPSRPPPISTSSSSIGFEENIALMVHRTGDSVSHHDNQKSAFAFSSLRRSLNRYGFFHNQPLIKCWSLLCFAVLVVVVTILCTPSRVISNVDTTYQQQGNLRASHPAQQNITAGEHNNIIDTKQNELLDALYELPLPTTYQELDELNEELKELDPKFILQWAHMTYLVHFAHHDFLTTSEQQQDTIQHPLVQVTSFGPTGLVILDILSQLNMLKDVPIITMDTLHLFPESYEFYETVQSYYGIKSNENDGKKGMELIITKPLRVDQDEEMSKVIDTRNEFDTIYGSTLWKTSPKEFTKITKIDPLNKVLDAWQVHMWITGRRRSSGGERSDMNVLEFEFFSEDGDLDEGSQPFDASKGRWKLNPLAYWTYDQVWENIRNHKLPYNALYDKGYTSLGDEMSTGLPQLNRTSIAGDDSFERSGRFIGQNQTECGLHSHRQKINAQKQQAEEAGEEFTAPTLVCDKCIDLSVDNFENIITAGEEGQELLLEFYSPYCGGCQDFAPTLNRIANQLSSIENTRVARFDITEYEIPQIDGKDVFKVELTPTLFRVRYMPLYEVELYNGDHSFEPIMTWFNA